MTRILLLALLVTLLVAPVFSKTDYKVVSSNSNTSSISFTLSYTGKDDYYGKPTSPISKTLYFIFHTNAFNDFYFKITDPNNRHFQIPQYGIFPSDPLANFSFPISASAVRFEHTNEPFDFRIVRKQNGAVLFSTYDQNIVFSEHYLEIGTQVDSQYIYGIGERFLQSFRKTDGKWTIFNRDRGQIIDKGQGLQTYGYYPFYLLRQRGHLFHINYLRSSNAMDMIKSTKNGKPYMTYKVIGGVFDFRFFLGQQSPETTLEKMNLYMGRSAIPPFWGLGHHQCRWGYKDVSYLEKVLENFEKNDLPLDTIWNDIDYMIDYEDFTIDENRFPLDKMKAITDKYRYIPIIDAGIKTSGSAYEQGLKRGIYVKDSSGQKPYIGKVWPGATTFVDFFHPNASNYWQQMLGRLYDKVQFSGVWLDMNELANFCDGACEIPSEPSTFDYSKDLPYQPGSDNIQSHTISLNSTHYGNISQADAHAYSAFLETESTNAFLKSKNLRPFIISRSSTFGSHKYGFHWTGDNYASWPYLKGSISDNFNSQMFGIQMVGPDICGFGGNTTEQLCSRWYQLATLYPFSRNHNAIDSKDQQPYALGDTVLASAKTNLKLRYSLLKYMYSLFINKRGVGTIWRPLFFEFPQDNTAFLDQVADSQFLVGPNLMAAPILEEGKTDRKVYFPEFHWTNLHTGQTFAPGTHLIRNVKLTDPIPLFVREATIIFTQNVEKVRSTKQLDNSFLLSIAKMRYDTRRSNSTHQVYEAIGAVLSIKDYEDNTLVDLCSKSGCDYIVNAVANITANKRTLELDIFYAGEAHLNQQIFFHGINMAFGDQVVQIRFESPLEITGPRRVTVDIPKANNKWSLSWEQKDYQHSIKGVLRKWKEVLKMDRPNLSIE